MKQTHWQLLFDIARVALIHHPVNSSAFRCDALDSRVHWCIPPICSVCRSDSGEISRDFDDAKAS